MMLADRFTDLLDDVYRAVRMMFRRHVASYCHLETAIEDSILVADDGSLCSIIHWNGSLQMIGADEFNSIVTRLTDRLSPSLRAGGHMLQVVFTSEGSESSQDSVVEQQFESLRRTAKRLKLDFDDVLDDRYKKLRDLCASESCYLVVWSTRSLLSPDESKTWLEKEQQARKSVPPSKRAQYPAGAALGIVDAHRSLVDLIKLELKTSLMDVRVLENHEALRVVRIHIDPDFTDNSWNPSLPGDPLRPHEALFRNNDLSHLLYQPLSTQLFPRPPMIYSRHVVIGDRMWAPVLVRAAPLRTYAFQDFFARMRSSRTPYRVAFQFSGAGLASTGLNRSFASYLRLGSNLNKKITSSFESLIERETNGESIVGFSMIACTWVRGTDESLLRQRASVLARALQAWGGCDTSETPGNALECVLSSVPALLTSSAGAVAAAPLGDALKFLPWHRPASPWDRGSQLLRTPDGKPYLFQPYSDLMDAWVSLYFAGMGGGKSVAMGSGNLSLVLDENNEDLPLIRILDIGFSSSGFISLMQNALPPDQSHRAVYRRLRMTRDNSMNPFDTMLGQRTPTSGHRAWLQGFLTFLCSPGDGRAIDGISDLMMRMIDKAFFQFGDSQESSPRRFAFGTNPHVDEAVRRLNIGVDGYTSWWEIEDALFKNGDVATALIAHRYAVPTLGDVAGFARHPEIAAIYGQVRSPSGDSLVEYAWRKLVDAIEAYPILATETRFELGNSPIIALDLQEVASGDSEAARRMAAVSYMLSMWVMSSEFFIGEELLPDINPDYRAYHTARLAKMRRVPRRMVADELHRPARAAPMVLDTMSTNVREGRKWMLDIHLASQRLQDFPDDIVDLASSIYIIKAPTTGADEIQRKFKLSETPTFVIEKRLSGPSKEGAPFVVRFATKRGTFMHHLVLSLGPIELWALSTSPRERVVRDALYKELGAKTARQLLAARYPSGEITEEIKRRVKARAGMLVVDAEDSVVDEIIAELIAIGRGGFNQSGSTGSKPGIKGTPVVEHF